MIISELGRAQADPALLPSTATLLASGGDARIALDPSSGVNQYGCPPHPDEGLLAFGSSTASVVSHGGFAAAEALRRHVVERLLRHERPDEVYAEEMRLLAARLSRLCGVAEDEPELVFAASGTDIHLIAAQLCASGSRRPLAVLSVEAAETGSGVPNALSGRNFSSRTALGLAACRGEHIAGASDVELVGFALRDAQGLPRPAQEIDVEVARRVEAEVAAGRQVLVVLADVSKTGMLAPSVGALLILQQRHPGLVRVLVDACQLRLAPQTLRAYLACGWLVGISGSKFITGPTF
ncbi:MAG: hypothetical protein HGA47_14215, partial [Zoogloea sp.]|nr:hypothetical protein [Zoogloea sp.]